MSLDTVAACDAEMEALTIQLERARQKKAALARERELREQEEAATMAAAVAQSSAASTSSLHTSNPDDLQRQIDDLKRQLALQEQELQTAVTIGSSYAAHDNEKGAYTDASCRMPQRRSTIKECHSDPNQPPVRPTRCASTLIQSPEDVAASVQEADGGDDEYEEYYEEEVLEDQAAPVQTSAPVPSPALSSYSSYDLPPAKGASEQAKQKHSWEKPAWALPDTVTSKDDAIQTDSIQHGLKAAKSSGYERKVHHKETLELVPGTFVAHQEKIPDPRMVWIVVNLDGSKVGKIAMHLYGNFLPLTDIFLELKGLELKHQAPNQWYVDDIEPTFYVHQGSVSTFTGPKTACFGVVFEGQDVLQTINQAIPSGAVVTIKQSHIYPVKKAK